jgi:RimJ/RimL family protein N-acetyltransferase
MRFEFHIRPLETSDTAALSEFLTAQDCDYIQLFAPFDFGVETIRALLARKQEDAFFGIFWQERLAAFFMLRGWDEGYGIPAYGVVVDQQLSGRGLGQLTLEYSKAYCRLRGCRKIMLKVHPLNLAARHIYEKAGFVQTGVDPKNQNLVYHCLLSRDPVQGEIDQ